MYVTHFTSTNAQSVSVDINGNIYVTTTNGLLRKYNTSGLLQSDKWIAELSDEQIAALPYNITTYSTTGIRAIFYHKSAGNRLRFSCCAVCCAKSWWKNSIIL